MNKDQFKDRMRKLEQERDEFVERLTPEGQQEYKQKKNEYSRKQGFDKDTAAASKPEE